VQVAYTTAAAKALTQMPANTAKRIRAKIERYAADPASQTNNVKKLKGRPGFRLRIGDYRVIFDRQGNVLAILQIGPRGSIYED
jgi:mRNA interferase RelE/StbE